MATRGKMQISKVVVLVGIIVFALAFLCISIVRQATQKQEKRSLATASPEHKVAIQRLLNRGIVPPGLSIERLRQQGYSIPDKLMPQPKPDSRGQ